jgi:predicted AlkP superfamily pyrophosphatase or phosphodiesterase
VLPILNARIAAVITLLSLTVSGYAAETKPKLVVAIIIDQFRYDYLTRFRPEYHAGFDQLLTHGADFTGAFYAQVPTVTAVGHSIFLSGAMPAVSGIVSNTWYDRDAAQLVTSVCDWDMQTVGGRETRKGPKCTDADPASPRRLLVTTVGDELRLAHRDSKVIGVSLKARAAILPSGHAANGAYWFDDETGNFVSSTFYMKQLPGWAQAFNSKKLPEQYLDRPWSGFPHANFHTPTGSASRYSKLAASPWGNELVEGLAEEAVTGEGLGQRGQTDLLAVSFSSNDYIGHAEGPYSPQVKDMALRADQLLGKLFHLLDEKVGMQNVLVVLSADHGVAATPAQDEELKIPGGYLAADIADVVSSALNKTFGQQTWLVPDAGEASIYFDREALRQAKGPDGRPVTEADVYRVARDAILATPQLHVSRVYSRDQLQNGVAGDFIAQAAMNGFFPRRSGDLSLIFEPGYVPGTHGTTHFTPYAYDTHVPVVFMGAGIKSGRYTGTIHPNDIAPTLAGILDLQPPSGSSGRVLSEMLVR